MSTVGGALGVGLLGVAVALALYRFPQSWSVVLAGGLGLTAVLALAIARYDAAVFLGFMLLGVVQFEPAPPDAALSVVIAVALVTGRVDLERIPLWIGALLGAFLVLNLLSAMEAIDTDTAAATSRSPSTSSSSRSGSAYVRTERRARLVMSAYIARPRSRGGLLARPLRAVPGQSIWC